MFILWCVSSHYRTVSSITSNTSKNTDEFFLDENASCFPSISAKHTDLLTRKRFNTGSVNIPPFTSSLQTIIIARIRSNVFTNSVADFAWYSTAS